MAISFKHDINGRWQTGVILGVSGLPAGAFNRVLGSGRSGAPADAGVPGTGSAGDIFMQSMFPLHSGRIIGLSGAC